jgi:hypothetical protein
LEDHRIAAKSIAEELGISRERIGSIIHEDLDMREVIKWGLVLARQCPGWLSFQYLDHPPSSPCLAPLDYNLFPGLEKQLKGRHFLSDAEVIAAAETWLDGQPSEFF